MTLQHYLAHRRRFEILLTGSIITLFIVTLATSEIIENIRAGAPSDWLRAWATEGTAGVAVLLLIPLLAWFLRRLNLNLSNLRWRAAWLLAGFLIFSLLHIAAFTGMRILLWAAAGESYRFGSIGWGLLYEMRKDLLVYIGIVAVLYGYEFILNRLQGEARFLNSRSSGSVSEALPERRTEFLVKMLSQEYLVRVGEIDWIESAGNYVLMHCGDRTYPMRSTLTGIGEVLDPGQFMRVHRTAIVNLQRVETLNEDEDLRAQLCSGELVPVSRTFLPELRKKLPGAD